MADLLSIAEAIKIQFAKSETTKFVEECSFQQGGYTRFTVSAKYEIIGAFIENDRINVVLIIKKFDCVEFVSHFAIESFEKKIKQEIVSKIPEAEGRIEILAVRKASISALQTK